MSGFVYLSKEGYEKIQADLKQLKEVKRPELSEKISIARDFGDLKETVSLFAHDICGNTRQYWRHNATLYCQYGRHSAGLPCAYPGSFYGHNLLQ